MKRGVTAVELVLAGAIVSLIALIGAFLFLGQVRGYRDLRVQAELQTQAKEAVQHLVREISNAGALLNDPARPGFSIAPARLKLAYRDVKGRYCAPTQVVNLDFFVRTGPKGDALVQEIRCGTGELRSRTLVSNLGRILVSFRYFDDKGGETSSRQDVQRVRFTLELRSPAGKSLFAKTRKPEVDVALVNF